MKLFVNRPWCSICLVFGLSATGLLLSSQDRDRDNRDRDGQEHARDDHNRDRQEHARDDHDRDRQERHGEYRFQPEYRTELSRHYDRDLRRFRDRPDRRHDYFHAGERLPNNVVVQLRPVPRSYYRSLPPPPPGYRLGYYDGYVVAYDPTTRIVADVLDLINAASR